MSYDVIGSGSIYNEYYYRTIICNGIRYPGVRLYDADSYMHVNVMNITVDVTNAFDSNSSMVLDEVIECINDEGEVCVALVGLVGIAKREFIVEDKNLLPANLKRGDILRFAFVGNKVSAVTRDLSLSDPGLVVDTTPVAGAVNGNSSAFGYFYSFDGAHLNLYNPNGWNNGKKILVTSCSGGANAQVTVYDARNDKLYLSTLNELHQTCSVQADGTFNVDEHSTKILIGRRFDYTTGIYVVYY